MFVLRTVTFRLQQSPKWLSSAGRTDEAVVALRKISHINGESIAWTLNDVVDQSDPPLSPGFGSPTQLSPALGRTLGGEYQGLEGSPRPIGVEADWGTESQLGTSQVDIMSVPTTITKRPPASPEMLEGGIRMAQAGTARTEERRKRAEQGGAPTWIDRLPSSMGESVDGYMARLDELFSPT